MKELLSQIVNLEVKLDMMYVTQCYSKEEINQIELKLVQLNKEYDSMQTNHLINK